MATMRRAHGAQPAHMTSTGGEGGGAERPRVVLASQSAVRARLLAAAGVSARRRPVGVDEERLISDLRRADPAIEPSAIALRLAEAKALAAPAAASEIVIGADQILVHAGAPLQKAPSLEAAAERLWSMRGRAHALVSGCALARGGEVIWRRADVVSVMMRVYSRAALEAYLAAVGEDVLASVACYEIEGLGAQLISDIDGDYFAALGLPLLPLIGALRSFGALAA